MKIFLSYPRKDKDKALQLKEALFGGGYVVWMDDQLIAGADWRDQLGAQIKQADAIVLALTPNWVGSPYCNWEFITAVENGKYVIPVLLEKTDLPERISRYQYADLSAGFDDAAVQKLLNDLVALRQTVDSSAVADMDKDKYAGQIEQQITVSGNENVVGNNNTITRTGNITVSGSVSGGNVNIGGSQVFHGNVSINYSAIPSEGAGSARDELKSLLQDLEAALKQTPSDQAEDIELVQEYANEIAEEAAKDAPRKRRLEISGEGLQKAAENLANVAPIAVKIARTLLMIG